MPLHGPYSEENTQNIQVETYQCFVGDLSYLANCTRPDLTFIAGKLGAEKYAPSGRHWNMPEGTFRYVQIIKKPGLIYRPKANKSDTGIELYRDQDVSGDRQDRKLTSGGLTTYQS